MKINECKNAVQYELLAKLEKECFAEEPWSLESIGELLKASIRQGFLLQDNDRVVGYVILTCFEHEAEIERIGIALPYRQKGLGKYLLLNILDNLKIERCFLDVSVVNSGAIKLYESCAFQVIGQRSAYYRNGADALLMEWKRKDE